MNGITSDLALRCAASLSLASAICSSLTAHGSCWQPADASVEPDPPLAGPAVDQHETRTLVNRSMARGFVRLEGRPEVAVVDLLDLPETTRIEARALGRDRVVQLSMFLVDRIDDLREITDDTTAGRTQEAQQKTRNLWTIHDPTHSITPLLAELVEIVGPDAASEAIPLIDEYLNAWIRAEQRPDESLEQTRDRLAHQMFQEEIRAAYNVSLQNTRRALDAIYDSVQPTPEQREGIRSIIIDYIKRTRLEATADERRAVMREIYDSLDEDRRGKLFDYAMRVVLPENQ